MKIKEKILYYLISKLVEPRDSIDEKGVEDWLAKTYADDGFRDYLTSRYSVLTQFLLSNYKGDDVYKGIIAKITELREMEIKAKSAYMKKYSNKETTKSTI